MCRLSNVIKIYRKRPELFGSFSDSRFDPKPLLHHFGPLDLVMKCFKVITCLIWIRIGIKGLAWQIDVGHNEHSRLLAVVLDVFVTCLQRILSFVTCSWHFWIVTLRDSIGWRHYSWMVSAIVGTHLDRATKYLAYPFDVLAGSVWSFSKNSSRQHWDKVKLPWTCTSTNRFIIFIFHVGNFGS